MLVTISRFVRGLVLPAGALLWLLPGCRPDSPPAPVPVPVPVTAKPSQAPAAAQASGTAAPAAPSTGIVADLALLEAKLGPALPRPEVPAGQLAVLGGFIRNLQPAQDGQAEFLLEFDLTSGGRNLAHYKSPTRAEFDLPAEGAVRLDLGVPLPADLAPGSAEFRVRLEQTDRQPVVRTFPFTVTAAAVSGAVAPAPGGSPPTVVAPVR